MWLYLAHPKFVNRNCDHCLKYVYDEETGLPSMPGGRLIERIAGNKPPCQQVGKHGQSKCPKGSPDAGREWSEKNKLAFQHWQECKAVGEFPTLPNGQVDPIVKRNAGILSRVEREYQDAMSRNNMEILNNVAVGMADYAALARVMWGAGRG